MTPRTIRLEQAKLLKAVDENGTPLVEEPQPEQQQILVQPNITFSPEIKVPQIEPPAITIEQPAITVEAPDMQPVADAITAMAGQQPVVQVAAPDMAPIADAIKGMTEAINGKPDHIGDITAMLKKIADRPQNARWKFVITRDAKGDIETMDAVKEMQV